MSKLFLIFVITAYIFSVQAQQEKSGRISGLVYTDYFYNISRDAGIDTLQNLALTGKKDLNGFDFRRIYFTYDYTISEQFSTRFRLEADGRTLSKNDRFSVFVKDAFIRWKDVLPGQDLIFGIQPTPAFEYSENVYGFRSLEKTIMDLRGIVSSREFGLALRGKVTKDLGYWLQYGNNSSSSPETDKYKRIYANLNYKFAGNFITTLYGDLRFRPHKNDEQNNSITTAFFLGYQNPENFSGGAEVVYQVTQNEYAAAGGPEDRQTGGISLFSSYKLSDIVTLTARADIYDPAMNDDRKNDARNFYIAGVSFKPVKELSIIPNILIEQMEDSPLGSYETSVTARLTLSYEFF